MYKVFDSVNEIVFSSDNFLFNAVNILSNQEIKDYDKVGGNLFHVHSDDPYAKMMDWYKDYVFVEAAGGLVVNNGRYLWIYRNNMWDLPKGKLEGKESFKHAAVREVIEECGLNEQLEIVNLLYDSYHTYSQRGCKYLKKTRWYLMNYNGAGKLSPQTEEGITKVVWATREESCEFSDMSYGTIKNVWGALEDA